MKEVASKITLRTRILHGKAKYPCRDSGGIMPIASSCLLGVAFFLLCLSYSRLAMYMCLPHVTRQRYQRSRMFSQPNCVLPVPFLRCPNCSASSRGDLLPFTKTLV